MLTHIDEISSRIIGKEKASGLKMGSKGFFGSKLSRPSGLNKR